MRRLLAVLLLLPLLATGAPRTASSADSPATPTPIPMSEPCQAPLTLTLAPGNHWPGAGQGQLPQDLPPGPVILQVPLYPGATITTETETRPSFGIPAVNYIKSASTTYRSPAGIDALEQWYKDAFAACGYSLRGRMSSGQNGAEISRSIEEFRQEGRNQISVTVSFESSPNGGTLILYVALAITPPDYPVPGSPLRVPGNSIAVSITKYSSDGMHPLRATQAVEVDNAAEAASLADEINHLPKPLATAMSCPMDDGSHDTLVFRDADGSTHVVRVDLRGCRVVAVPTPAPWALADDALLSRLDTLLSGSTSRTIPSPYDARTLVPRSMGQLGTTPGRFLSTGQNGQHLLYLSNGALFVASPDGFSKHRLAGAVVDASFTINDASVVARPVGADLAHLRVINTKTGSVTPLKLPREASLIGHAAGIGAPRLSDSLACDLQYVWLRRGRQIGGINPTYPTQDWFWTSDFLPRTAPGQLMAVSCHGIRLAFYWPGKGLIIRLVGQVRGQIGDVERRLSLQGVSFLSWAQDDVHLAYRVGGTLYVLDVTTGQTSPVLQLGSDVIRGAAWDPWSHVIALAVSAKDRPASSSRIVLANLGGGTGSLPMTGATRLNWTPWSGQTIGVTRLTPHGPQAWQITLPSLPPDAAAGLR